MKMKVCSLSVSSFFPTTIFNENLIALIICKSYAVRTKVDETKHSER